MNEKEKETILKEVAKWYKLKFLSFKNVVEKVKTEYPDVDCNDFAHEWNEKLGIDNYTKLLEGAKKLWETIGEKFIINQKDTRTLPEIKKYQGKVDNEIKKLQKIMAENSGEKVVKKAKKYLESINGFTDLAIVTVSGDFDSLKYMRYRLERTGKYLNYMKRKLNKLVAEYKKISPNYDYKEPEDFFDVRGRLEEIYGNASKKSDITMDEGKSTKFKYDVDMFFRGTNNFKDIKNSFDDLYEAVSESVNSDKNFGDEKELLDFMNERLKGLVDEFNKAFPDHKYEYKASGSYEQIESSLYKIYKTACLKNMKETDESKVNAFRNALEEKKNIKNSFIAEYECALKAVNSVSKLSSKKSDVKVKRQFETIYGTKVLPLFSENNAEKRFTGFKKMYKDFKGVKKSCPKFYKFMESICSKNEIKKKEFNTNVLLAVLFASCYAADNMAIADAVCRGLRKITKDPELKIYKWEELRIGIKNKINSSQKGDDDTANLRSILETKLKDLPVDYNLVKTILDVAEKTSHKQKKLSILKRLFSSKH